jgi:hypothetical protein
VATGGCRPTQLLLVGHDAILLHLRQLGLTEWSKRPLTWTTVRGWARWHGFPLTPGTRLGRNYERDHDGARDHSVATEPAVQRAPDACVPGAASAAQRVIPRAQSQRPNLRRGMWRLNGGARCVRSPTMARGGSWRIDPGPMIAVLTPWRVPW